MDVLLNSKRYQFTEKEKEYGSLYGFHGTSLENVWSILAEGFKLGKFGGRNGSLYGEGIYLATEANISLNYLSEGNGWIHSNNFSDKLGVMFICQVVDNSQYLEKKTEKNKYSDFPSQFIVAKNPIFVRPKFMLVFSEDPQITQSKAKSKSSQRMHLKLSKPHSTE